jgi:nucleotide-binding universal stress UspA family protein
MQMGGEVMGADGGSGQHPAHGRDRFELGTDGPKVLVVGFDGSPTSVRAGAYAAGLARRQGSRLVAVHVASTPVLAMLAPGRAWPIEETLTEITEELRRQVREGASYTGLDVEFIAARGDPFVELSRIATELRADAVVVGASTSAGHRFVGSLAVKLVRAGRWPVITVP